MATEELETTFIQFGKLLQERFSKDIITTEDSVRYAFFHCLTKFHRIDPSDIVLELPHVSLPGCFVDTYVEPQNDKNGLVFEFKYDRKIPSGRNSPRTQKAGKVFADLFRLALFKDEQPIERYFVYVTDNEMVAYFNNATNKLDDFFNLPVGRQLRIDERYIRKHARTFVKSVGKNISSCEIWCRSKVDNDGFSSRIYEVIPNM